LDALCPASPAACLGLGWSLHSGIDGPRDDVEAAKRFALVCRDTAEAGTYSAVSSWVLQRKPVDHRRAACLAYRWLVDVGAAEADPEADAAAQSKLTEACERPAPSLPRAEGPTLLTECVQSRLGAAAKRSVDPIPSIPALELPAPISVFASSVAFVSEQSKYATLAVGLYAPLLYSADLGFLVGTSTSNGATTLVAGFEQGVAPFLLPHIYLPVGAVLMFSLTGESGDLLGAHAGVRWTYSRIADKGIFVDLSGGVASARVAAPPGPSAEAVQDENLARELLGLPPAEPVDPQPRSVVMLQARLAIGYSFGY
jgi:hypothetical protein